MNKNDAEAVIRETIEYANNEIKKNRDKMRMTVITCIIALFCVVAILFFPFSKTIVFSGNGNILNSEKEPIDDCAITIEVTELKSLVLCYKMDFSCTLNGTECNEAVELDFPASFTISEYGDCVITQDYYHEDTNSMKHWSLFYRGDYSYAEVYWEDNFYTLSME